MSRGRRSVDEINDAVDEMFEKVWYNRHMGLYLGVVMGKTRISYRLPKRSLETIAPEIWKGAREEAERVELKYGAESLGWTDFEYGLLTGKLSALRWILGDDWDMLDT